MKFVRKHLVILLFVNALATFSYALPPRASVEISGAMKTIVRSGFDITEKTSGFAPGSRSDVSPTAPITDFFNDTLVGDAETRATVSARSTAEMGGLHIKLLGTGIVGSDSNASVTARAVASWFDNLTITVPASSGLGSSSIFVNSFLNVDGIMSVTGNGTVGLSIRDTNPVLNTLPPSPLQIVGFPPSTWGFVQRNSSADVQLLPPSQIPIRIGIFLGSFGSGVVSGLREVGYEFALDITANAGGGVNAIALGEYGNTVSWGGITSVETSSGAPVTNYVVTSESGFDYSRPFSVPEPAGISILAALVGGTIVFRRRRPHRQ